MPHIKMRKANETKGYRQRGSQPTDADSIRVETWIFTEAFCDSETMLFLDLTLITTLPSCQAYVHPWKIAQGRKSPTRL